MKAGQISLLSDRGSDPCITISSGGNGDAVSDLMFIMLEKVELEFTVFLYIKGEHRSAFVGPIMPDFALGLLLRGGRRTVRVGSLKTSSRLVRCV